MTGKVLRELQTRVEVQVGRDYMLDMDEMLREKRLG